MLDTATVQSLARQLYQARKSRTPLRHFSKLHLGMTVEDGYAIQREWVRLELADGRRIRGRKIGLTSRAMQQASQIDEPDYAPLMDDMFFEQGSDIPASRFIAPRIEVELAFILGRPLKGPGVTLFDVLAATEFVTPAVEIIDARIEQFDRDTKEMRKVFDTISDFAANAGIVTGGRPVRPDDVDLRWVGALLHKNGVIEESGLAAAVLNHPANGVAWLANKIAAYDEQLDAGDLVLAGSFTRPTTAKAGDVFHVDYGALGSVAFRFV
jgi:2-oxo-hept-3-ene-1,7-dioate hydratase